jgi:ABC-type nitrate/sulfonate/bicarbonate transport system ATPase subunit
MSGVSLAADGKGAARAAIELDEVVVSYDSGPPILERITLDVAAHEVLCLIGQSGCGKSTLLNVIAGLLPLQSGRIAVAGQPVQGPGPDRVMVFQDDAVLPWFSVWKNVAYGLYLRGMPWSRARQEVSDVIRLVGLEGSDELFPRQLSGGMRKRVDLRLAGRHDQGATADRVPPRPSPERHDDAVRDA